ncbi:MAG: DUF4293 domain-containing protein [Flavobacteriia bacterium]|nr:DUF4293 domain-containing protein [Flavobacteriia bacterium]
MIQRIQTVYLLVSIICLSIVSFGTTIITGVIENGKWILTAQSLDKKMSNTELDKLTNSPLYLMFLVVALLCLLSIFQYKNLKRQLMISRLSAFLYFLSLLFLGIIAFRVFFSNAEIQSTQFGMGFFLLIIGLITSILAIYNIKKDQKLIDSLNRLR